MGLIIAVITLPFTDQIASILCASGETLNYTSDYLKIEFLIHRSLFYFVLEQFARAIGKPIISMIGMLSSVGINIILDPILIFGLHLDVVGAALGTAISNAIVCYFSLFTFQEKMKPYHLMLNMPNQLKR